MLARDGDRTVLTMVNDFQGTPKEFAMVIPVPNVITRGQIHIGDKADVDRLDAFTAPRLVEYFDEDPCAMAERDDMRSRKMSLPMSAGLAFNQKSREEALGVRIEASYTVGEYDILILSATQSAGLETWLREKGYGVPPQASRVLAGYLKQGMKFFVAKVNLKEQAKLGFNYLRPIQVAFEHPRFMLPIRLGMANAQGAQELFVYALSRKGRVETTNYRTVKLPSDLDLPTYVKGEFPAFYRAMFEQQVRASDMSAVFTEYAWDMAWCDPCAAQPLSNDELRRLGVFWLDDASASGMGAGNTFVTRLHLRYDAAHFPEDLVLQETADRTNFQGRYVLRHPWKGDSDCPAVKAYRAALRERRATEARNLASLTGWQLESIRSKMAVNAQWVSPEDEQKWWDRIWKQ